MPVRTAVTAPVVSQQTTSQNWKTGQAINLALAAKTFTDPQGEAMTYTATLANGAALPTWLRFNGATETFAGTAPTTATSLSIKVTATDAGGVSASETFVATVTTKASAFVQAISSLPDGGSVQAAFVPTASNNPQALSSPLG